MSNAPEIIDSFNACMKRAVAVFVLLKMRVGEDMLYITLVPLAAATVVRDRLVEAESITCWIVMSSSLQS